MCRLGTLWAMICAAVSSQHRLAEGAWRQIPFAPLSGGQLNYEESIAFQYNGLFILLWFDVIRILCFLLPYNPTISQDGIEPPCG